MCEVHNASQTKYNAQLSPHQPSQKGEGEEERGEGSPGESHLFLIPSNKSGTGSGFFKRGRIAFTKEVGVRRQREEGEKEREQERKRDAMR